MAWYHYFGAFWAGMFLANVVPHFVKGISGERFPTPFAKPPGKGLSSPTVNTVWSLFNLVVGYLLFRGARLSAQDPGSLVLFFTGIAVISIYLSKHFTKKD